MRDRDAIRIVVACCAVLAARLACVSVFVVVGWRVTPVFERVVVARFVICVLAVFVFARVLVVVRVVVVGVGRMSCIDSVCNGP